MNIQRLAFYLMLLIPVAGVAQHRVFISATVGQYYMENMKDLQQEIEESQENESISLKSVAEFPASVMVDAGFLKAFEEGNVFAGGYLNYAYTKGRLHYSDYSGEAYIDLNVKRIVVGGEAIRLLGKGFELYGKAGLNYSMLKIVAVTEVYGGDSSKDDIDFYSLGFSAEGGFAWKYNIKKLGLGIHGGYEVNIQGKTLLRENREAHLEDSHGHAVKMNWSGARIGLDLSYTF